MFESWRIKWAAKFGKKEHFAGRLLGVLIAASLISEHYDIYGTEYLIAASFVCWCIYLISHTVEKKLYGNLGSRSRR